MTDNFMEKETKQELQTLLDQMKFEMGDIEIALRAMTRVTNDIGELLSDKPKDEF